MVGDDDGVSKELTGRNGTGTGGLGHGHISWRFIYWDSDRVGIVVGIRVGRAGGDNGGVGDAACGAGAYGTADEDGKAFARAEGAQTEHTGPGLEAGAAIGGVFRV